MVDVLVTHSYHLAFDPKQLRKMQPYPPLATLYAATALRDSGISVAVFDSMLEEPARGFDRALDDYRPRIVVVYEDDFNFLSKMCLTRMREVAWGMAAAARSLGAVTIVHGSDATDHTELFLRNGFDYVCRGEAEQTLVQVCRSVLFEAQVPELDGVARLDAAGRMAESGMRLAKNPRWAELSFPARDLIDLEPYRRAWRDEHGYFSVNMVSSRGCPYQCNWCAKPISGNQFHLRPAAAVAAEMKLLKERAGVEHIWFGDDIFALDHGWTREFAEEVTKRDAGIPFKIQSRANLMTECTVEHLRVAGCAEVWMGVESGSQAVLDSMDKGLNLTAVRSARVRLKGAGIRACYFLQLGYPGETWPELLETVAFVRETRPDDIGVSFSYPLPGTVFYERVREQLGMKRNWTDSDDLCIMFKAAYKTEFYRAVRDALHAEVDSWNAVPDKIESANSKARWRRIYEMEHEYRNPDALASSNRMMPLASSAIVPLAELAPARSI